MSDEIATATDRYGVLSRSTLLRHTLAALVGIGLVYLVIQNLSDYRNSQLAPVAFTLCAAAGLTLLVGQSGQISLGHGAFMAVGAYTLALIQGKWTLAGHGNVQLIALLAAAAVVAGIFGAVMGIAAARLRGPYLAGATLALAIGLPSVASYEKLSSHLGGNTGLLVFSPNPPNGINLYKWQSIICCLAAVVVLWFLANVSRSRVGRSFRAVRDDEIAASLCGLSVARVQVLAFIISAACAGVAGALLAVIDLTAGPQAFPLSLSLGLLAAIVFGGLGSMAGAVYGSFLVVFLPYWSQDLANRLSIHSAKVSNNLPLMVYGLVLAVAMLAAPNGVQGVVRRVWLVFNGGSSSVTRRKRS
jgi:branched-chain amino acid transport system permease protein